MQNFFLFARFKGDVFLDVESGFGVDTGSSRFGMAQGGRGVIYKNAFRSGHDASCHGDGRGGVI